jgi:hypothetical protein
MRRAPLIALFLATACAGAAAPPALTRAPDYSPRDIRQPALFIRIADTDGLDDREREALTASYEGALVEAFDERGVPPTDVQPVAPAAGFESRSALARAREVRADHAIIVHLSVQRRDAIFCRDGRRPFSATTTVWSQGVQVLRVRDGTPRMTVPPGQGLDVTDIQPDCSNPRRSRLRDRAEMIRSAVETLVERVLGR